MATQSIQEITNDLKMRMKLVDKILEELNKIHDSEPRKADAMVHYLGQKRELQNLLDNPMTAAKLDRYSRTENPAATKPDANGNITIGLKPASLMAKANR